MATTSGSQYLAEWTTQMIKFMEVAPSAIIMYDYVLTLEEEVDFIWSMPFSVASAIYLITRYIGTALILLSTTIFISVTITPGTVIGSFFLVLEGWANCIEIWLVQILLQMRLYAIYHGSKKVLLIGLFGFVAEIAITITCMVQITKFEVSSIAHQTRTYPTINYAAVVVYEFLLFALAVYAAIQRYREDRTFLPVTLDKMKDLRTILIGGNVAYFLGTLLYVITYLVVSLTLPTPWMAAMPRLGFAVTAIIGCHLVLHVRSSRPSTGLDSHWERESYPLVVLCDYSMPSQG
ncbi:hypothetical protein EDC04DRAFT_58257 [Pisolithus marmoratus]|nr:hypothetical protein EDC04DRAFT_58257 [Pisolithus marmoratus]